MKRFFTAIKQCANSVLSVCYKSRLYALLKACYSNVESVLNQGLIRCIVRSVLKGCDVCYKSILYALLKVCCKKYTICVVKSVL